MTTNNRFTPLWRQAGQPRKQTTPPTTPGAGGRGTNLGRTIFRTFAVAIVAYSVTLFVIASGEANTRFPGCAAHCGSQVSLQGCYNCCEASCTLQVNRNLCRRACDERFGGATN